MRDPKRHGFREEVASMMKDEGDRTDRNLPPQASAP